MVQITSAWGHFLRDGPRWLDASLGTVLARPSLLGNAEALQIGVALIARMRTGLRMPAKGRQSATGIPMLQAGRML